MIFEGTNLHNFEQPACTGLMARVTATSNDVETLCRPVKGLCLVCKLLKDCRICLIEVLNCDDIRLSLYISFWACTLI